MILQWSLLDLTSSYVVLTGDARLGVLYIWRHSVCDNQTTRNFRREKNKNKIKTNHRVTDVADSKNWWKGEGVEGWGRGGIESEMITWEKEREKMDDDV